MVDVQPDWKAAGGTRQPKKRGRARTTAADWRKLHAIKGDGCRLCGQKPYELHHLISKARGGPDEAWNLCPLCPDHHRLVTDEDAPTLAELAAALHDDEYAGVVELLGQNGLERLFKVRYEHAIGAEATASDAREWPV